MTKSVDGAFLRTLQEHRQGEILTELSEGMRKAVEAAKRVGAARYEVKARLKYKIESRKLSLWFETIGLHVIIRDSVRAIIEKVTADTGINPLIGVP